MKQIVQMVTQFLGEVRVELGRVVWPKFDEWIGSTIVVLVVVIVAAFYLWVVDLGISKLAGILFTRYSL